MQAWPGWCRGPWLSRLRTSSGLKQGGVLPKSIGVRPWLPFSLLLVGTSGGLHIIWPPGVLPIPAINKRVPVINLWRVLYIRFNEIEKEDNTMRRSEERMLKSKVDKAQNAKIASLEERIAAIEEYAAEEAKAKKRKR